MKKKGFSLIELALVLIIIGILLSLGIGFYKVFVRNSKFAKDKYIVKTACEAVKGYAFQHKNLPTDLTSLGIETINPYNQPLKYNSVNISGDFCKSDASNWLKVDDRGNIKDKVAFIVYSTGENRKDDTNCSQSPSPCSSSSVDYQIREYDEPTSAGTKYDDIVCYMDIYTLRENSCPKFEITTSSLPEATQYLEYDSGKISVSGGTVQSCNITLNVQGLSADNTNCKITGTPEVYGTFPVTITVTDTIGRTAKKTLNLVVNPNPVKITTPALPYGYENESYKVALTASGGTGAYTWIEKSFDLDGDGDADLNLNSTGILEANQDDPSKPESKVLDVAPGTYEITVKVCDANYSTECDEKTFPLTVLSSSGGGGNGGGGGGNCSSFSLSPSSGTYTITVGESFNLTITPSGGKTPYTNISCSPSSCKGLTLSCDNSQAVISGTANSAGTCTFGVSYEDSCSPKQTASGTYTINITCPAMSLTSNLSDARLCDNYTGNIRVNGGLSPYSWELTSGSLPKNISFCNTNSDICEISGEVIDSLGSYTFGVSITDSCLQSVSGSFSINVIGTDMTGIYGEDCSQNGINLCNVIGTTLFYKKSSSSTCYRLNYADCVKLPAGETYTIYTDRRCRNEACQLNFCTLWNVEKGNNASDCEVYIVSSNCRLSD